MIKNSTKNSIIDYLKENLDNYRLKHVLGTAEFALKLAKKHKANPEKAVVAGLLHDAGKINFKQFAAKIMKKLDREEKKIKALWHCAAGEYIARNVFKIKDKDILGSIRKHSSAGKNMSKLEKIIFISDKLEVNRKYKGVKMLRKLALKDLDAAFLECLKGSIMQVMEKKKKIYSGAIDAWNAAAGK
jgi:predicted HD superfamily hydrolase involved in NAD metabolism